MKNGDYNRGGDGGGQYHPKTSMMISISFLFIL